MSLARVALLLSFLALPHAVRAEAPLAKGADVGWLSQMEADGTKFYDKNGQPQDCLQILKEEGINAIRLRVWVNPPGHWCNQEDVVAMAKRVTAMGFRVMIDFHYSDGWADPQQQPKPAAWKDDHGAKLAEDVYAHTKAVLQALKDAGVTPEWVQVGNEITNGMLWPDADTKHFDELVACLNRGYDAVKEVDPQTLVVIHLNNGQGTAQYRAWFDKALTLDAKFDVIGMSLYPERNNVDWSIEHCTENMGAVAQRYGKPVVLSEIGFFADDPATTKRFLTAMIAKLRAMPNGKGLGIFYWEPEGYTKKYNRTAWGEDGRPTAAMDAFKD